MARILIVDDNFNDLNAMKDALTSAGHEVEAATNAYQALLLLEGCGFDLALIDLNLTSTKGDSLASKIREVSNPRTCDNPVKIAYVTITPKSKVDMKNADGFIQKPFDSKTLISSVKEILKK